MAAQTLPAERLSADEALEEERRRFIELLREGLEDVKAGRVIGAGEVERRSEEAIVRGAARWGQRRPRT